MKALLLYTMTSGLGDFVVMGDLIKKVEALDSYVRCLIAHRGNPYVVLWHYDNPQERFFNVYKPYQLLKLILTLKKARKSGFSIFGLQMAPGSIQGFLFHLLLKKMRAVDFIVDFNLINADIITPARGGYILDIHLNQVEDLLKTKIPINSYPLSLPVDQDLDPGKSKDFSYTYIGIHPWSRPGHLPCFTWPFEHWLKVIGFLVQDKRNRVIIFGKDKRFGELANYLRSNLQNGVEQLILSPSNSVEKLIETIKALDLIISVNTGVVHIGYALNKKMIILCGPSLDLSTPKAKNIKMLYDEDRRFNGSDKCIGDNRFPNVARITPDSVIRYLKEINNP